MRSLFNTRLGTLIAESRRYPLIFFSYPAPLGEPSPSVADGESGRRRVHRREGQRRVRRARDEPHSLWRISFSQRRASLKAFLQEGDTVRFSLGGKADAGFHIPRYATASWPFQFSEDCDGSGRFVPIADPLALSIISVMRRIERSGFFTGGDGKAVRVLSGWKTPMGISHRISRTRRIIFQHRTSARFHDSSFDTLDNGIKHLRGVKRKKRHLDHSERSALNRGSALEQSIE